MSTEIESEDTDDDPVCPVCLLRRVAGLVEKLAGAWWSEEPSDASMEIMDETIGQLYELLWDDEEGGYVDGAHSKH